MSEWLQGNVVGAYEAYYHNINPEPFAELVAGVGVILSILCFQWTALLSFMVMASAVAGKQWSICAASILMMVGYIGWSLIAAGGVSLRAVPVMAWCVVACGVQVKCVRIFQEWEGLTPKQA